MISDIIIVVLVMLYTMFGAMRGFLKTITGLAATVLSAMLVNWLSAPIGTWIYNTFIQPTVLTNIEQEITKNGFSSAVGNSMQSLPDWVSKMVSSVFAPLGISMDNLQKGVLINNQQAQQISHTIEEPIGKMISALFAIIAAVVLFILLSIILRLIFNAIIRLIRGSSRPGGVDRFFGGLFGFAEGTLTVLIAIHIVYLIMSLCNPAASDDPMVFGKLFNTLCLFR